MKLVKPSYECKIYEIFEPLRLELKFMEILEITNIITALFHRTYKYEILYIKSNTDYVFSHISILEKETKELKYSFPFNLQHRGSEGYSRLYAKLLIPLEDEEIVGLLDTYFSMQELVS